MINIFVQLAAFYAIVNLVIAYIGEGSSVGLAIVILLGTINTFLPAGMFVLAMPDVFGAPWFYIAGAVFTAIAAVSLYRVARFPSKPRIEGVKRPIW